MADALPPTAPEPTALQPSLASELAAASRLTGADIAFLQLVRLVSLKQTGSASVADAEARARLELVHAEFRTACAATLEKHLGQRQAVAALHALESAPVQRYLAARHAMAPALRGALNQLEQRMGQIEI